MICNQYVGELLEGTTLEVFLASVKKDAKQASLSTESIKMKDKDGTLFVQCTGDVANIIRKRSEVRGFRCDKIGIEKENPAKPEKK